MNFKFFILTVWLSVVLASKTVKPPACNSLPIVNPVDMVKLASFSPFTSYQTNDLINFQCAKLILVGSAAGFSNYNGTVILIKGNYTFSIDYVSNKNGTFSDLFCPTGEGALYQFVYLNLKSSNEAGYCITACDEKDGTAFKSFVCLGRGIQAYNNFQRFINESMAGVPGIVNADSNCEQPHHCAFFTN